MRIAQSSHIEAHDYNPNTRVLTIQFTNGAVYHYADVPMTDYYNFAQSDSPGKHFHSKIKGNFKSGLVAPGDARKRRR